MIHTSQRPAREGDYRRARAGRVFWEPRAFIFRADMGWEANLPTDYKLERLCSSLGCSSALPNPFLAPLFPLYLTSHYIKVLRFGLKLSLLQFP